MTVDTDIREAMRHVIDPEIGVLFMFNTVRSMALKGNHGDPI